MQVIRFNWNNEWQPELLLSKEKGEETMPLLGPVDFSLGSKFCIGYYDKRHHSCPTNQRLLAGRQCRTCKSLDTYTLCLPCDGTECLNPEHRKRCRDMEYVVYLAAFGDLLKVGISQKHRLEKRFVEQGADFAAGLLEIRDGRDARVLERQISEFLGITDRVWGQQKADLLLSDPNDSVKAIESAYKKLTKVIELPPLEIHDLRSYYHLSLDEKPSWLNIHSGTKISGDIIAGKGSLLFLKGEDLKVLDAHRMVGRLIRL